VHLRRLWKAAFSLATLGKSPYLVMLCFVMVANNAKSDKISCKNAVNSHKLCFCRQDFRHLIPSCSSIPILLFRCRHTTFFFVFVLIFVRKVLFLLLCSLPLSLCVKFHSIVPKHHAVKNTKPAILVVSSCSIPLVALLNCC
jgi:hypothetical protein